MTTHCGYIALVGRPNVGKSTLLNRILSQKISITSRKPQTTRHRILGIHTDEHDQYVFVDTPGIHSKTPTALNKIMNKTATTVLRDVDLVVFVVDALRFTPMDEAVLALIRESHRPCILIANKIDKLKDKSLLLPWLTELKTQYPFVAMIPASAKTGVQVDALMQVIRENLPENPHFFPKEQVTDRSTRFICAELLREKIFRLCGDELPYATTVEIEAFEEGDTLVKIHALIWVDRESHKRMIIGEKGQKLKEMAGSARIDMEKLLGKKVFLKCWCKVKSGWSDDKRALLSLGYDD